MSTPNIAWVAGRLLDLHSKAADAERTVLVPSLETCRSWLVSDALVAAGFPLRSEYDRGPRHVFRAKLRFCTGTEPDAGARCHGRTSGGSQCRNRPTMGIQFCHVHSTDEQKEQAKTINARWIERYTEALRADGVQLIVEELDQVLDLHRSNLDA